MKKLSLFIWVTLLISGCVISQPPTAVVTPTTTPEPGVAGTDGIGDPYFPKLGNGGYDVTRYIIVMDVDPTTNDVTATTTIEANATESLKTFNLDFIGLDIDSITVSAQPATYARVEGELKITPAETVHQDQPFTTIIQYHGNPQPYTAAPLSIDMGWNHAPDGTINVWGEPDAAPSWFPNNDHPRDKATYRFEITVPKPWVVAANGSLQETLDQGNKTTFIWEMDQPMATYLATINIDKYEVYTATAPGNVLVRSYYPADLPAALKRPYGFIPLMIGYFNRQFGSYPFNEYGVVIADKEGLCTTTDLALEAQTLSIHCPSEYMGNEYTIAHELAHQWFGDSVSLKNWQDIWLKEGLATYASWLWADNREAGAMESILASIQDFTISSPIALPPKDDLYRSESYVGGALVFHALHLTVGDEVFFKILQTYHERYRYSVAGTEDFIAVAEEISGQDLSAFFKDWLYRDTLPEMPAPK